MTVYACSKEKYYELLPTDDLEKGHTSTFNFETPYSSSTESLPERTLAFSLAQEQHTLIIQRKPLTRFEISCCATKYILGSLICAGIGIGSYFLAENIMHEEDKVNDYLLGINQSLTSMNADIAQLTNLTKSILEKL